MSPTEQRQQRRVEMTRRIAHRLYERRLRRGCGGSREEDWLAAEKIARSPVAYGGFRFNQWLKGRWRKSIGWYESTLVEYALETLTADLKNLAVFDLLSLLANLAIIISLSSFLTNGERQRHDQQVYEAWQVITNAYGQPGNGGRRRALEFLNSTPGTPGRRRWFGLPWPQESLRGVDITKANLAEIKLPGAFLNEANLQDANLAGANLRQAFLGEANLQEAILVSANLQNAFLGSTNLQEANLSEVNLRKALLGEANLQQAVLRRANLQQALLTNTNLQQADLREANLQQAILAKSNLQQADLRHANLQRALLTNTNLQQADLLDVDFQETDLSEVSLEQAVLAFANLQQANLRSAGLQQTLILATDLRLAQNLTIQQLAVAKLCNVALPESIQGVDPNRDCEAIPQILVDYDEHRAQKNPDVYNSMTLQEAEEVVELAQQRQWEDLE